MKDHPEVPVIAVTLYAFFIYFGQKYMETREPFKWRKGLVSSSQIVNRNRVIVLGIEYAYISLILLTNTSFRGIG